MQVLSIVNRLAVRMIEVMDARVMAIPQFRAILLPRFLVSGEPIDAMGAITPEFDRVG
jgi:hypothetical protein